MMTTQKPGKGGGKKKPVPTPMTPPRPVKKPPKQRMGPMGDPAMPVDPLEGLGLDGTMPAVSPAEAIAGWLVGVLEDAQIERLELRHTGHDGDAPVKEWEQEDLADQDPDAIAAEIFEMACEDGSTAARVSRYVVLAYRPGDTVHFRRHYFRVEPADKDSTFETEEADAHGLVSQAHRHLEGVMRLALGSMNSVVRSLQVQNQVKDDQLRAHTTIQLDVIRLQGELVRRTQDIELNSTERRYKVERKERIFRTAEALVLGYLPFLTDRLGLPSPKELLAKNPAAGADGAAAAAADDKNIQFDGDGQKLLQHVTKYMLNMLSEIDGPALKLVLARVPADARDDVRSIREIVLEHADNVKNGEGSPRLNLNADQKKQLVSFQGVVVQLLGSLSDMELAMMIDKFPENVQPDVHRLREVIQKQLTAAPAAASTTK